MWKIAFYYNSSDILQMKILEEMIILSMTVIIVTKRNVTLGYADLY